MRAYIIKTGNERICIYATYLHTAMARLNWRLKKGFDDTIGVKDYHIVIEAIESVKRRRCPTCGLDNWSRRDDTIMPLTNKDIYCYNCNPDLCAYCDNEKVAGEQTNLCSECLKQKIEGKLEPTYKSERHKHG